MIGLIKDERDPQCNERSASKLYGTSQLRLSISNSNSAKAEESMVLAIDTTANEKWGHDVQL
jgi:hypothetical protein